MFDSEIAKNILLYLPISIIGAWRWSFWVVRRIGAALYRPDVRPWPADKPKPTVSVVTPVYNEDPATFTLAMDSWIANGVDEIVAVIDKSNVRHILNFEKRYASNNAIKTRCRLLVTPKPGKRAALCDGIEKASGQIIALVDSDTIWGKNVLEKTIPYFARPEIGGATVAQRIQNPNTIGNVMFDILLWLRYREEVPFLLGLGKAFNTLSGRTAFYRREALLDEKFDNLHHLRHEFFMGTRGISGDDKRLTHLILEQGWHVAYVKGPQVYTPGLGSLKKFFKQRLRWTRNSWRADLRAVGRGWVWMHPALAIFMIDRFIQPFIMLIGPVVLTFALIHREWLFAGILIAWWAISRFLRLFGYFRAYPRRLVYLPAYIIYGYVNAIIKIYALATLVEHSWATRGHKIKKSLAKKTVPVISGSVGIVLFFILAAQMVSSVRQSTGNDIPIPAPVDEAAVVADIRAIPTTQAQPALPLVQVDPTKVGRYVFKRGDTLQALSVQFGMSIKDLKQLNEIRDADKINAGDEIVYFQGSIR